MTSQEKIFERLGGTTTIPFGTRYIAAKITASSTQFLRYSGSPNAVQGVFWSYNDGSTTSLPTTLSNSGILSNAFNNWPVITVQCQ